MSSLQITGLFWRNYRIEWFFVGRPPGDGIFRKVRWVFSPIPKPTIVTYAALTVVSAWFGVGAAWQIRAVVDAPTAGSIILFAVLVFGSATILYAAKLVWFSAVSEAAGTWRYLLLQRSLNQPVDIIDQTPIGVLVDRIDGDVEDMAFGLTRTLTTTLVSIFATLGASLLISLQVPVMALVVAGTLLFCVVSTRKSSKRLLDAQTRVEKAENTLVGVTEEIVVARDDLIVNNGVSYALGVLKKKSAELVKVGLAEGKAVAASQALLSTAVRAVVVATMVVAVWGVRNSTMEIGVGISLVALAVGFSGNILTFTRAYPLALRGVTASRRVVELAFTPIEKTTRLDPVSPLVDSSIQFKAATFTYPAARIPACNNITFRVAANTSVGLVGHTGAGKTTLVRMLTRQVDTPSNMVFVGGVDICNLSHEQLREIVTVIPQQPEIFSGTLMDNITLFAPITRQHVSATIELLGLTQWVQAFPNGLHTPVGDGNNQLSSGEKQLVGFIRAMVAKAPIIVLDEPTSHLDYNSEQLIAQALERTKGTRTVIVIAHKVTSLWHVDTVAALTNGTLAQHGTLKEVALTPGVFQQFIVDAGFTPKQILDPPLLARKLLEIEPATQIEKPKVVKTEKVHTWKVAFSALWTSRRYGLLSFCLFPFHTLFSTTGVGVAALWAATVMRLQTDTNPWALVAAIAVAVVVGVVAFFAAGWLLKGWFASIKCRLVTSMVTGQLKDPPKHPTPPGEVVSRSLSTTSFTELPSVLVDVVILTFVYLIPTAFLVSKIAAAAMLAALFAAFFVAFAFMPRTKTLTLRYFDKRAETTILLAGITGCATTLKAFNATKFASQHYFNIDSHRASAAKKLVLHLVHIETIATYIVATLTVGIWVAHINNILTLPQAVAAFALIPLLEYGTSIAREAPTSFSQAKAWLKRVQPITQISNPLHPPPPPGLAATAETLKVMTVTNLHTTKSNAPNINNINFTVKRGETIAVIGATGSGKTTLLKTVVGLIPHSGTILWNGHRTTRSSPFFRSPHTAYIPQTPHVLTDTIHANVTFEHPNSPDRALRAAHLTDEINTMGGTRAIVGYRGKRLSGGQLQRLAIARALTPNPQLVVADLPTSAVDTTTQRNIWTQIQKTCPTVIVATTDPLTAQTADRVLVLLNGQQVAFDKWENLSGEHKTIVASPSLW